MKKAAAIVLILAVLASLGAVAACAEPAEAELSPAWVGELEQAQDAQQLFVVAGVGETTAWVSLHEKDADGVWRQLMTTPGFIGKYGLGKQAEGDGMTPVGTFTFNRAFGIAEDPGCAIAYQQVDADSYWSGDQREGYAYNELVSLRDLPELNTDESEHIVDYPHEYQYCLNISYNAEGTPGLGSAIFLHCLGAFKPYTGGCVAIPQDKMIAVMQQVRPDCAVVIDSLKTLSPETWEGLGLETHAMGLKVSDIFTVEELDAAAALIQAEFETWDGCEMHLLHYAGDASCTEENLAWLNSLAEGKTFTRCAEFLSDFHTAPDAGGAWNPDAEYSDWQWWLACTDTGEWELLTWGY